MSDRLGVTSDIVERQRDACGTQPYPGLNEEASRLIERLGPLASERQAKLDYEARLRQPPDDNDWGDFS